MGCTTSVEVEILYILMHCCNFCVIESYIKTFCVTIEILLVNSEDIGYAYILWIYMQNLNSFKLRKILQCFLEYIFQ